MFVAALRDLQICLMTARGQDPLGLDLGQMFQRSVFLIMAAIQRSFQARKQILHRYFYIRGAFLD